MKKYIPFLIFVLACFFNVGAQGEQNGGLGSIGGMDNSPFLQGDGTSGNPWVYGDYTVEDATYEGNYIIFNGKFKIGDYVNFGGTVYELYLAYPELGILGLQGYEYAEPGVGTNQPYFKLPLGAANGLLLGLAFLYGGLRFWRRKKEKNSK